MVGAYSSPANYTIVSQQDVAGDGRSLLTKGRASPKGSTNPVCLNAPKRTETQSTLSDINDDSSDDNFERGNWSKQLDFFLSCVGYAVGLGNIWRFPYLCYQSGGGAFLVPYFLFLIICGFPLFFLEMSFGQFASLGPVAIWKISPLFKGLGYGMVIISGIVCIYYNVIIAWTLYYIYHSLGSFLPWSTCGNSWNDDSVCVDSSEKFNTTVWTRDSTQYSDANVSQHSETNITHHSDANYTTGNRITASEEFWLNYVLQISPGIDDLGSVQWPLVLTLFIAWVVVFLCLMKGVKTSGKVVYFSATFPYIVLVILLIRGVTLPGAKQGIIFYLYPRWELLKSFKVWGDAATQIFYSVGASWGAVLTMASYNRFNNNCYRDSLLIPLINCGTSVFAGLVVFSIIGFMAHETGKPIDQVVSQGPGLAFVVYPEAVSRLPISPLWALLFFIMLFTIGLDSQFGMFEAMISAFVDEFQILKKHKVAFTAFMCFVLFVLGIPCVTQGGMYVLQLMDWYSAAFSLMIISLFETLVIGWVYGADRFMQDICLMIGHVPPRWWKLCWCFITPITIFCLLVFIFLNHTPVTYGKYEYPSWSVALGWMMAMCSLVPIPLLALTQLCRTKGTFKERLLISVRPSPDWGPALEENRLLYRKCLSTTSSNVKQCYVSGLPPSDSLCSHQSTSMDSNVQNADRNESKV